MHRLSRFTRPALAGLLVVSILAGCGSGGGRKEPARTRAAYSVLFVGDTAFGEGYQRGEKALGRGSVLEKKGYAWCFSRLKPLLNSADLVVANLETPLTRQPQSSLAGVKQYLHWSDPEKAGACLARNGIDVVCLANNHAMDYDAGGLADTLAALKKQRIAHYGAGKDEVAAAQPCRREFSAGGSRHELALIGGFDYRQKYDALYGFYAGGDRPGVHPLDMDRIPVQIERLKRKNPDLFVVVTPHWGRNYGWRRERDVVAARRMIDAGADLVIGHGARHFQGIERYKGRWILYNIGNFAFNSPGRYAEKKSHGVSMAVRLELRSEGGKLRWNLRCYPLLSDNLRTGYRSRLLTAREFESARGVLARRSPNPADWRRRALAGRDGIGRHIQLRGK